MRPKVRAFNVPDASGLTPRVKQRHPEAVTQRLFVKRWRLDPRTKDLPACAIPNGGKRNVREATLLKAEGVDRGVPDWMLYEPSGYSPRRVGLALEFKAPTGGRVSADQVRWHDRLRARGWQVEIVFNEWTAWEIVEQYLGFKGRFRP